MSVVLSKERIDREKAKWLEAARDLLNGALPNGGDLR